MTGLRAVLDTNVWLDWLVFDDPSTAPIKAAVDAGRAEVFIDAACEAELERALGYDLGKRTVDIAACIAECRRVAHRIESPVPEAERAKLPACRDPDDQKFLEAALAARGEFLLTRDRALLELAARVAAFRILTPEGFAGAFFAVGELRRDDELARAPDSHAAQALFPAGHDFLLAEGEFEGVLLFLAGTELRSVGEPAGVVHGDVVAGGRGGALADDGVFDGQAACGGDGGHGTPHSVIGAGQKRRRTKTCDRPCRVLETVLPCSGRRNLRERTGISYKYFQSVAAGSWCAHSAPSTCSAAWWTTSATPRCAGASRAGSPRRPVHRRACGSTTWGRCMRSRRSSRPAGRSSLSTGSRSATGPRTPISDCPRMSSWTRSAAGFRMPTPRRWRGRTPRRCAPCGSCSNT